MENFILGKILGKGSYGSVRIVERKEDHQIYAMKSVVINILGEKEKQNSFNEVRLLASLKHQNIIYYNEAFFDENEKTLNIVMEYADGGDLRTKISDTLKNHLSFEESTIWNVLIQTLEGLKYLHKNNIIHRDLKSANIFLTQSGLIKIGDLNVSTIAKKGVANTQTGTPYYASPEIWNDKPYNSKCDIWSLGCIIYEMASLHVPFRGTSLHQLYCRIMKGVYPQIPSRYSNDLKIILKLILNVDAQKRPSAEELLKNDIILKKIKELGINQNNESKSYEKAMLIKTIKIPKNISQINQQLPKKRYKLKQKNNKEEMFNNDEYEYSKKNFFKITTQDQNKIIKENNKNIDSNKINEINITTNDTDRINIKAKGKNEIDKNDELKNLIINQNNENNNLFRKEKLKKPYKDTGYHFFMYNNQDKNKNIANNNINQFLINNKQEKPNESEQKQRRNTGGAPSKYTYIEKNMPNIRTKSTNNGKKSISDKLSKNNDISRKERNSINWVKALDKNNNQKNKRKYSCVSANKRIKKNISNNFYLEKDIVYKINTLEKKRNNHLDNKIQNNIESIKRINKNQLINHIKSSSSQKQRPISTKHYNKNNLYNVHKLPNINNEKNKDKNKLNCNNYYNQIYKNKDENLNKNNNNDKNKLNGNKHQIIYERIEIVKNGKINQYHRGKPQVKYIDAGNHYIQYKNFKNNIYDLRAKNNYQIYVCGKGANIIIPNKMV